MNLQGFGIGISFGIVSIIIAFISYSYLWSENKHILPDRKLWNSLSYIISYIPGKPVFIHILIGLLASVGIATLLGYLLGAYFGSTDYNFHSTPITVTSFVLAIIMAIVAIWTLYQTKKIEYQQGYKIDNFQTLIEKMNSEIDTLYKSYTKDFKYKAQEFHRVYIITEHPFFGMMSYPDEDFTRNLKHHFNDLKSLKDRGYDFKFEMVCADKGCVEQYIKEFFGEKFIEKIKIAKEMFERDIAPYEELQIATRVSDVPNFPQFAIIGNTIFEFILIAKKPRTELMSTNVIFDRERCKLYIHTFELLKEKL